MTRRYAMTRRAERVAETRQKIVEAALQLHTQQGPVRTSLSQIAELAGVQRHTLYTHFPDERSLLMACSALALERHPFPVPGDWAGLSPEERLTAGLTALYVWYEGGEALFSCIERDAGYDDLTREIATLRIGAPMQHLLETMLTGLPQQARPALTLLTSFASWQNLVRLSNLSNAAAVALAVRLVLAA